ncbi:hypothetical protein SUDANB176_07324 [Streptomyces sp. enrichment culture]|uniref:hypothetical protein n=1 Tax=Streptomyces sp. enrichment culture TaxID=1795815 RepID=UPI003F543ABD
MASCPTDNRYSRPSVYVRRHFEAMVFHHFIEELRCGDAAVAGSEEYADWSRQLLKWEEAEARLPEYLVEVGFRGPGDTAPFDAAAFRAQLRERLTEAAVAADSGSPDNEGLFIDPKTGIPTLERYKADERRPSAVKLERPSSPASRAVTAGRAGPHRLLDRMVAALRPGVRPRPEAQRPLRPVRHHDLS